MIFKNKKIKKRMKQMDIYEKKHECKNRTKLFKNKFFFKEKKKE